MWTALVLHSQLFDNLRLLYSVKINASLVMVGECWMFPERKRRRQTSTCFLRFFAASCTWPGQTMQPPHQLLIGNLIQRSPVSLSNSERAMTLLLCTDDAPCPDRAWECVKMFPGNDEGECQLKTFNSHVLENKVKYPNIGEL